MLNIRYFYALYCTIFLEFYVNLKYNIIVTKIIPEWAKQLFIHDRVL